MTQTWGCGGCVIRWSGLNAAHCPRCHRTFSSHSAADMHDGKLNTETGYRPCLFPGDKGMVLRGRAAGVDVWTVPDVREHSE